MDDWLAAPHTTSDILNTGFEDPHYFTFFDNFLGKVTVLLLLLPHRGSFVDIF